MCWPYVVGQFHFASKCFITLSAWRLYFIVDALVMIIQRIFRHELLSTNVASKVSSHFSEICCVLMFLRRPAAAGMNWHFCFHLKGCWRPEKFFTKWEPNSSSCHPFIMVKNRQGAHCLFFPIINGWSEGWLPCQSNFSGQNSRALKMLTGHRVHRNNHPHPLIFKRGIEKTT